jgi:hypothetical protein
MGHKVEEMLVLTSSERLIVMTGKGEWNNVGSTIERESGANSSGKVVWARDILRVPEVEV